MNKVIYFLLFIVSLMPLSAYADDDYYSCSVQSKADFSVAFDIEDTKLEELVWIQKKNGKDAQGLWTNDSTYQDLVSIYEGDMRSGRDYSIWLWYEHTGNANEKKGTLHYYLMQSGNWVLQDSEEVDLSGLNANSLSVVATGEEIENFSCGDSAPPPDEKPDYNEDAQVEFGTAYCSSTQCSFSLTKTYQYTPMVFLMPTITKQDYGRELVVPDDDAPASVFLTGVDIQNNMVTFEQKKPSRVDDDWESELMVRVDYLVVEPGTATFGDHQLVAGYVDTNKLVYSRGAGESDDNAWQAVAFADFGLKSDFSENPVVLTQVQSSANSQWLTAAMRGQGAMSHIAATAGVELSLELSRSQSGSYDQERVGFVAALPGSGKVGGYEYNIGRLTTPVANSSTPMAQACSVMHDLGVDSVAGVVAKKMERNGSQGGWLRRCRIQGSKASFVVDEDHWNRKHTSEQVGFFTVDIDYQLPAHCEYFPGAVQSHTPTGDIEIYNQAFVHGQQANFKLGFGAINDGNGLTDESCRTDSSAWKCQLDSNLVVEAVDLPNFPSGGSSESHYDDEVHPIEVGTYQRLEAGDKATLMLATSGDYWVRHLTLNGEAKLEVAAGAKVRLFVENLQTNIQSSINHNGNPDDFILVGVGANANIHLTGDTTFNGMVYSENKVTLDSKFDFDGDITQMPATITGAVTARSVFMSGTSNIRSGGMCFTPVDPEYQIVVLPVEDLSLTCDRQPVEFIVQDKDGNPAGDFSGKVEVTTSLSAEKKAYWYLQETEGEGDKLDISLQQDFSVDSDGKVMLWLKSDVVGTISATGTLSTETDEFATGQYGFVPFKFEINDERIPVVAGKPEDIVIKARACSEAEDSSEVSVGYDGERTIKLETGYDAPAAGSQLLQLRKSNNDPWQGSEIKLVFDQGVANAQLQYLDAGQTTLSIHDPNCSLATGCEILPQVQALSKADLGDWTRLEGTQTVLARPYTFALCNHAAPYIESASGTASSGNGFVASGNNFSTEVKPVIWLDGDGNNNIDSSGNATGPVDSSGMCQRMVTDNFYADDAPAAVVGLSIPTGDDVKPHSPTDEGAKSGALSYAEVMDAAGLVYSASWNEAGSILLQADTQANYLGMDINMGYRPVGRFYPDHFAIQASTVSNAINDTFTYMGQGFPMEFTVEARNSSGGATNNYGFFGSGLLEELELVAVDSQASVVSKNDLIDRIDTGLMQDDPTQPNYWATDWELATLALSSTKLGFLREAQPDGPYIVDFGLLVKPRANCSTLGCTDFNVKNLELRVSDGATPVDATKLSGEIDARYGRMIIEDAAGHAGHAGTELAIPLRTEYWEGGNFVTNMDDSVSHFDGKYRCKQQIAQSDSSIVSNSSLSEGEDKVTSGNTASGKLVAIPHRVNNQPISGYREQVRFWLKLTDSTPAKISSSDNDILCESGYMGAFSQPWLLYDWRGVGDENPSAVVTFGTYRGNDRIIYRGEKGINTLLD